MENFVKNAYLQKEINMVFIQLYENIYLIVFCYGGGDFSGEKNYNIVSDDGDFIFFLRKKRSISRFYYGFS